MSVMAKLAEICLPVIENIVVSEIDNRARSKIHQMNMESLQFEEKLLDKAGTGRKKLPQIPLFQFEDGEDVDELGSRMWGTYHQATLSIPDDAKPHEVRKVMRDIEKSIKKHPCGECREHSKKNLKELPLTRGVRTKKDAVKRVFDFHNLKNQQLKKPHFSKHDFEREYSYTLD